MQFYFIRHAQSTNNALWDNTGQSVGRSEDPELTSTGVRQAQRLAKLLAFGDPRGGEVDPKQPVGFGLTHLYTSLMLRAVATASIVSDRLGLPVQAWIDAHEEGGVYLEDAATGVRAGLPGRDRSYFEANYPGLVLPPEMNNTGWWNCQPFETSEARTVRAHRFLTTLLEKHGESDDYVAVVSHGGFYNQFLAALYGNAVKGGSWAILFNTGVSRIDFNPGGVAIVYLNRTDHLPPHLLT
ncbi:MAG: histidine phosphatase family protein [Anaerolineaceae bacterium]|nr:histidine phosphatase family protein [Anaerolineaceae bacterium]